MDFGGYLSLGMKRMGAGDWTSAHCAEKIQEMLSRAIKDQEDLWKILISSAPSSELGESAAAHGEGQLEAAGNRQQQLVSSCIEFIPAKILRPLTAKLENSLDWCHLALCRIKEFTARADPSTTLTPIISQQAAAKIPRYPKLKHNHDGPANLDSDVRQYLCSRLKLHRPLNSLRIPERTVDSSSMVLDAREPFPRNLITYCFRETRNESTSLVDPSCDLAGLGLSLNMLASDLDPCSTQGQNVESQLHPVAGGMQQNADHGPDHPQENSSAMDMTVDNKEQLTASVASYKDLPRISSSNHLKTLDVGAGHESQDHQIFRHNDDDGAPKTAGKITRPNNLLQQVNHDRLTLTSARRNPIRVKREREGASAAGEEEKVVEVVYQRLRPGIDVRKGIPQDGHKGWKKYGNKSIHNANFCRGYYKCSAKECNAKKMVQPTDEDPSVFEVTYMGIHTCGSSNFRHKKQHRVAADHVPVAAADAALTQESRKLVDRHQSPKRIRNAQRDQAASVVRQQKEKNNSLAGAAATSVKGEEKSQARIMQPDHQKNNLISTLDLPAAAGSTDQDAEEKALDLHLQAADFSIWSTELGAAGSSAHATADQLTTSSDLDSFAEEAPSSNNYSRSDQAVATTHDDHQQQDSKTFALDHQHEEAELQGDRSHQTAAAATHEADLHMQEMTNAAGYLASGLEGLEGFDIHQLQLHHLHHHGHIHDQLPNAQALPSFHEFTIFDSWADLGMDMHHLR